MSFSILARCCPEDLISAASTLAPAPFAAERASVCANQVAQAASSSCWTVSRANSSSGSSASRALWARATSTSSSAATADSCGSLLGITTSAIGSARSRGSRLVNAARPVSQS